MSVLFHKPFLMVVFFSCFSLSHLFAEQNEWRDTFIQIQSGEISADFKEQAYTDSEIASILREVLKERLQGEENKRLVIANKKK